MFAEAMPDSHVGHWGMLNVNISRAENGFILRVNYPNDMLPKPPSAIDGVMKGLEGLTSGHTNPEDFLAGMMKNIKDIEKVKNATPIRKVHETYVFTSMEPLIKFLNELFGDRR